MCNTKCRTLDSQLNKSVWIKTANEYDNGNGNDVIESVEISNDENFSTDADSTLYESIGDLSKISELETQNENMNRRLESLENILYQTNDELQKQKEEKGNLEKQIVEISFAQNGSSTNMEENIGKMNRMIENCEDSICELNEKIEYLNWEYQEGKSKENVDEKHEWSYNQ